MQKNGRRNKRSKIFYIVKNESNEEDNGQEMKENVNVDIFKNIFLIEIKGRQITNFEIFSIYEVLKERDALNSFIGFYSKYLDLSIYPEEDKYILAFIKSIRYAYF